jgi:hypothetical protein
LTELSGDWAVEFTGKAWDKFDQEAAVDVKAKGIEFINMPNQEVGQMAEPLAPIKDEYAADLEAKLPEEDSRRTEKLPRRRIEWRFRDRTSANRGEVLM